MQSGPEFPRIDGAAVILVEAGERFAARFDLLVREGHPHTEAGECKQVRIPVRLVVSISCRGGHGR